MSSTNTNFDETFLGLDDFEDDYDSDDEKYLSWRQNKDDDINLKMFPLNKFSNHGVRDRSQETINFGMNENSTFMSESLMDNKTYGDDTFDTTPSFAYQSPVYNALLNSSELLINTGNEIINNISLASPSSPIKLVYDMVTKNTALNDDVEFIFRKSKEQVTSYKSDKKGNFITYYLY